MRVEVNGTDLYYEIDGHGPSVVLMHGWTLNLRMWDPQVERLRSRFRVVRFDRRGFGRSGGAEDVQWDAVDLHALLDHLGVERIHLVGMSQAGSVALRFALHFPRCIASLILAGSTAPAGFPLPWNGADRMPMGEWQSLVRDQGLERFRAVWRDHPAMHVSPDYPEVRSRLSGWLAEYRGTRLSHATPNSGPVASATMDDLPGITAPTLVLIGEHEMPYLTIVAHALAYYMPQATLTMIPGGGHLVNLEQPDAYTDAIAGFIDRTVGRP